MQKRRPGSRPATIVKLLMQIHSLTKNLENNRLAGPCLRVPKSAQNMTHDTLNLSVKYERNHENRIS